MLKYDIIEKVTKFPSKFCFIKYSTQQGPEI